MHSILSKDLKEYIFAHRAVQKFDNQTIAMKIPISTVHPIQHIQKSKPKEGLKCFCHYTAPVFKLASLIGLNITTTKHESDPLHQTHQQVENHENTEYQVNYCHSAKLLSLPSIANIFFTLTYIYLTIWLYRHLGEHLGMFFHGVDYYTLAVDVVACFVETTFLLLYTRAKGSVFVQALHEIQTIYENLKREKVVFEVPKNLKALSIGLVVFILTTTVIYGVSFLYLIFVLTFPYINTTKKENMLTLSFVAQKFGHFLIPLYSQSLVALFIVCTEVVRQLYIHLAQKLRAVLKSHEKRYQWRKLDIHQETIEAERGNERSLSEEVEACRLLYYKLYNTVGTISNYFGCSLLVICCLAVLSVTATIYTIILYKADQEGAFESEQQRRDIITFFYCIWGFHLFFAVFNLGGILISGQRVTFASQLLTKTIQESELNHIDRESKFQINLLSQAVYGDPVEISACSITKMSMTFVASACGNIITYILVLLQFRWSGNSA